MLDITQYINNVWLMGIFVLVATASMEYFWATCVKHVADSHAIRAANNAVVFWTLQGFITISFVANPWMLIPVIIGTWIGTYVAIWSKRNGGEK